MRVGFSLIRTFSTASRTMASPFSVNIAENLKVVHEKIRSAATKRPQIYRDVEPRLLAVSKTKGVDMIIEAYDAGQRHFGENYVMELHDKASDIELQDRCQDIKWHFIGHLQRNKVNKVLDVPNLHIIEAVDSQKLAKAVNDGWGRLQKSDPLRIYAQCNTSREENKSGCAPEELVDLAKYIVENCQYLQLTGLMTIGVYDYDYSKGPNPDFTSLISLREEVCKALDIPVEKLELSMGMSADFEQAIEVGSTNVRVGTQIFGARKKKTDSQTNNSSINDSVQAPTEPILPNEVPNESLRPGGLWNYLDVFKIPVMELHDKASDIELQDRCQDIKWHFIGHLQRNKVNKVLDVPNLHIIEAVDSQKLAKAVNDGWGRLQKSDPLRIYAQCNTSREENKSGCAPEELVDLAKYIVENCQYLQLTGLMTIGVYDYDYSKGPNPDFTSLISLREEVCKALDIPVEKLELSMGMSADFEQAIEVGSTNVRVGTQIFGARKKKTDSQTNNSSINDSVQGVNNISIS